MKSRLVAIKDLIEDPGYSYSALSRFAEYGKNIAAPFIPSYAAELGKYFEGYMRSQYDKTYDLGAKYYPVEDLPARLSDAIFSGSVSENLVRYKKDGNVYEADKELLDMINRYKSEAYLHSGVIVNRFPIIANDGKVIATLSENLKKTEFSGLTISDFLECARFDLGLVWETADGIRKKTQLDCLSEVEVDGNKCLVVFDFKLSRSVSGFGQDWRNYIWIQDRHVSEGIQQYADSTGAEVIPFVIFLIGYKDTGLCQIRHIDPEKPENIQKRIDSYNAIVYNYHQWTQDGQPITGMLETKMLY